MAKTSEYPSSGLFGSVAKEGSTPMFAMTHNSSCLKEKIAWIHSSSNWLTGFNFTYYYAKYASLSGDEHLLLEQNVLPLAWSSWGPPNGGPPGSPRFSREAAFMDSLSSETEEVLGKRQTLGDQQSLKSQKNDGNLWPDAFVRCLEVVLWNGILIIPHEPNSKAVSIFILCILWPHPLLGSVPRCLALTFQLVSGSPRCLGVVSNGSGSRCKALTHPSAAHELPSHGT